MSVRLRSRRGAAFVLFVLLAAGWQSWGRSLGLFGPTKPTPDRADVQYGPHGRNVLDFWRATPLPGRTGATPIVVYFHGGGFRTGDKSSVPAWLLRDCLDEGISVASANYRLSQTAAFPCRCSTEARAIQYLRHNAAELGIDPDRIASSGNSAGAGIALWVAFHDDLADPGSVDPVARCSSRVSCVGTDGGQTSYDPRFIQAVIGGRAHEHEALLPFFGVNSDAEVQSPRIQKLFEEASPINYVSSDDPPAILFYAEPNTPLSADSKPGQGDSSPALRQGAQSQAGSTWGRVRAAPLGRLFQAG